MAMSDNDELQQIAHLRREYTRGGLRRHDLPAEPLPLFERWLRQACDAKLADPTAMVVATVDERGQPYQRIVLLKHYDEKGWCFIPTLAAVKRIKLKTTRRSACFSRGICWSAGDGNRQSGASVDAGSGQIFPQPSARQPDWRRVSKQSSRISARGILESKFLELKQKFQQGEVPLPSFWGGFRVSIEQMEFWQGRTPSARSLLYQRDSGAGK